MGKEPLTVRQGVSPSPPLPLLRSRLTWLLGGRIILSNLVFAYLFFLAPSVEPADLPLGASFWITLAFFFLNLIYLVWMRLGLSLRLLSWTQMFLDVVLISLLVYSTGIERVFASLYFATVVYSALLGSPNSALIVAAVSSILLSAATLVHWLAATAVPPWKLPFAETVSPMSTEVLAPFLIAYGLCLHLVAFLSQLLAREMGKIRILSREVLENVDSGVVAVDREGNIAWFNRKARELLHAPAGPLEGRAFEEVVDRTDLLEILRQARDSGQRVSREMEIHGRPVGIVASPILDKRIDLPRGVSLVITDLTLRRRLEILSNLEERFRALLEMSASLAHEIRNPLASIKGAAQELAAGGLPPEDSTQLHRLLQKEVDRLDRIVTSFLEYASTRPMNLQVFDLSQVMEEVARLLEARRASRSYSVECVLQPRVLCKGDRDRLKQALLNVGINAIEALNGDGRILLRCRQDQGQALAEVEDNGCGIAPGDQEKIFDPFFSTKASGSGMGLAIARKIIQAHQGTITVESEPGKGTLVKIALPA